MPLPSATYPAAIVATPGEINTSKDGGYAYATITPAALTIPGSYLNQLSVEIKAIETELGTDPAGSLTDLKTRLAVALNNDGTLKSVALASLAAQAAYSFVVNNTSGSAAPTAKAINDFTAKTVPVAADLLMIADSAAGSALKKITRQELLAQPAFIATGSGNQTISDVTGTVVTLTDSVGSGIFASNTLTIDATTAGRWLLEANWAVTDAALGDLYSFYLTKNGFAFKFSILSPGGTYAGGQVGVICDLVDGDDLTMNIYVDVLSGTRNLAKDGGLTWFTGQRIG